MEILRTELADVVVFKPKFIRDSRGYFVETFRQNAFEQAIGPVRFVQENQSLSQHAGTIRGLHFQTPPMEQGKLVRCLSGSILDVAVDIRRGSPSYGRHVAVTLSAENGQQLWVPAGFAHGFCTLEPQSVVAYKVTSYYSAEHDRGLLWNDPELGIAWPVDIESAVVSEKDRLQPRLSELPDYFAV